MKKRKALLVLKISATLALLLFLPVSAVIAGNPSPPPPPGTKLLNPTIKGELKMTPINGGGTNYSFEGFCRGEKIEIVGSDQSLDYSDVDPENLLWIVLGEDFSRALPKNCVPKSLDWTPSLIIKEVSNFEENEFLTIKEALVKISFYVTY